MSEQAESKDEKSQGVPMVQVELLYAGGISDLNGILHFMHPILRAHQAISTNMDITGRRSGERFTAYMVQGVEEAIKIKEAILNGRVQDRRGRLIERVALTKLEEDPRKPGALTPGEQDIVRQYGFGIPEDLRDYF